MIPTISRKAKSLVAVEPKRYRARRVMKIVKEVLMERPKVCLTDFPTVISNSSVLFSS